MCQSSWMWLIRPGRCNAMLRRWVRKYNISVWEEWVSESNTNAQEVSNSEDREVQGWWDVWDFTSLTDHTSGCMISWSEGDFLRSLSKQRAAFLRTMVLTAPLVCELWNQSRFCLVRKWFVCDGIYLCNKAWIFRLVLLQYNNTRNL